MNEITFIKKNWTKQSKTYFNLNGDIALGYNHTLNVYNGMVVGEDMLERWLIDDVNAIRNYLTRHVKVPLTQEQKTALFSFILEIGVENFNRSSVLYNIKQGDFFRAAAAMQSYIGVNAVKPDLIRLRKAEANLLNVLEDS